MCEWAKVCERGVKLVAGCSAYMYKVWKRCGPIMGVKVTLSVSRDLGLGIGLIRLPPVARTIAMPRMGHQGPQGFA